MELEDIHIHLRKMNLPPWLNTLYWWIGFIVVMIMLWIAVVWVANGIFGKNWPQLYIGVGYEGEKIELGEGMIGLPCMTRITENKLSMAKYNDSSMPCVPDPPCAA